MLTTAEKQTLSLEFILIISAIPECLTQKELMHFKLYRLYPLTDLQPKAQSDLTWFPHLVQ